MSDISQLPITTAEHHVPGSQQPIHSINTVQTAHTQPGESGTTQVVMLEAANVEFKSVPYCSQPTQYEHMLNDQKVIEHARPSQTEYQEDPGFFKRLFGTTFPGQEKLLPSGAPQPVVLQEQVAPLALEPLIIQVPVHHVEHPLAPLAPAEGVVPVEEKKVEEEVKQDEVKKEDEPKKDDAEETKQ